MSLPHFLALLFTCPCSFVPLVSSIYLWCGVSLFLRVGRVFVQNITFKVRTVVPAQAVNGSRTSFLERLRHRGQNGERRNRQSRFRLLLTLRRWEWASRHVAHWWPFALGWTLLLRVIRPQPPLGVTAELTARPYYYCRCYHRDYTSNDAMYSWMLPNWKCIVSVDELELTWPYRNDVLLVPVDPGLVHRQWRCSAPAGQCLWSECASCMTLSIVYSNRRRNTQKTTTLPASVISSKFFP